MRAVVQRDIEDAAIPELSPDRRFATAYNAALQSAKMVILCEGYRVVGAGHHATTFEAASIAMDPAVAAILQFFDACRRKRNTLDYDMVGMATETEANALLADVEKFPILVEDWITLNHPAYSA